MDERAGPPAPDGLPAPPERVELPTARGPVRCLYHRGRPGAGAVVMVGGTDGGFDGPADGIYPTLADDLSQQGIGALRMDFRILRAPGPVEEGVFDMLAAIDFLRREDAGPIALMGHSYGAAVAIEAAVRSPAASAVVTLSAQTAGALRAGLVAPRPMLLVHGADDRRLPPLCSQQIYSWAGEPKELVILKGAKHSLRQRREDLRQLLVTWLRERLASAAPARGVKLQTDRGEGPAPRA